jgi:hypothetical protein
MKKIFGLLFILSVIIFSCKKDTPAPAAPVITYSTWSDCSNGVQTRTYTVSGGTATAPSDSLSRACDYSALRTGLWNMSADSVYVQELNTTYEIVHDTTVFGEIYAPCTWDDTYAFAGTAASGTYTYADAGTVCSPDGSGTGTWAITNNSLIWDGQTTYPGVLKSFSPTKMVTWTSFTSTGTTGTVYHLTEKTTYRKL